MQLKHRFKAHCSGIGAILSDPQGGTPMSKYLAKKAQIEEMERKYEALGNKETATAKGNAIKIQEAKAELPELKRNKDRVVLSKTCLAHVHQWIKSQPEYYGRVKGFKSKYTDKGNFCEPDSIEYAAAQYGWGMIAKNEETKWNDYLVGTCDIVLAKSIEDIKNSWSQDTFPLFGTEIPIDGYGWQLQGYMELWDKPQGGLIYTLMDAPEFLVEREARRRAWDMGMEEVEAELYDEVKAEMTYSHLRDELRIRRFFIDRDPGCIDAVKERVELINQYINSI